MELTMKAFQDCLLAAIATAQVDPISAMKIADMIGEQELIETIDNTIIASAQD